MKFLIDKGIPYAEEVFSTIGEVESLPAGSINRQTVQSADVLIVRSVTKVTSSLLEGSAVKFVGTATVGEDHIRLPDLKDRNIGFSSAPGCSSSAVAEFVINAACCFQQSQGDLFSKTLGIIGAGRSGLELKKKAELLGMRCLLNDPPLQEMTKSDQFTSLEEVIQKSNIISIHVPLTFSGNHPTFHFINESVLSKLNSEAVVINTSRGGVIHEESLMKFRSNFRGLILDVWENEPDINLQLLRVTDIATPHVAGYSWQAKIKATETIYKAVCEFFDIPTAWTSENLVKTLNNLEVISEDDVKLDDNDFFQKIFSRVYDIKQDDAKLRNVAEGVERGTYFRELRDNYRFRDEFRGVKIKHSGKLSQKRKFILRELGFHTYCP